MPDTVVIFGAGATKACGGPLTDEILPRCFKERHEFDHPQHIDLLEAFLSDAGEGGAEEGLGVERVEATGGVEVATPNEFVTGRRGTYYVAREVATLEGGVKITRGENQLNGEYAEVDLKAGVSRLLANPPAGEVGAEGPSKPERVRGLLVPRSLDN